MTTESDSDTDEIGIEQPLTDREKIAAVVENVEAGDELTVHCPETNDDFAYKDNREVQFRDSGGAQFGDPVNPTARVLTVRGDTPKAYELNDSPDPSPLVNGREITKLWVWEFNGDLEAVLNGEESDT